MAKQQKQLPFFSKGRRGSDSLKIAYIIFALLLAITTIVAPYILPLWLTLIAIVGAGPVWNIIDGFVDDGEQWSYHESKIWNKNKFHTYFNWICLGFLSTFALGLCMVAAMTQLTALTAGTAVVTGVPIALLIGPIGGVAFAITMLWLTKKSYHEINAFDKLISKADATSVVDLQHQRAIVVVDFYAWLSAGLGATGFAVLACLAFASIGFPPALPIIFIGIVLLSASIKLYQLVYHPKTPTANGSSLNPNNVLCQPKVSNTFNKEQHKPQENFRQDAKQEKTDPHESSKKHTDTLTKS